MKTNRALNGWLVTLILALLGGATWLAARQADLELRGHLLQQVRMVAQALDPQHVQALTGTETDLNSPDYQRLKGQLTAVRSAHPQCRFVYLIRRNADGTFVFLVDSERPGSKDYSPPGQVFDQPSADFMRVFTAGAEVAEGPITDRWGAWISALVPLRHAHAQPVVAVLGMDIDARVWTWNVAAKAALPVGLMLLLFLVSLLGYMYARLYRTEAGINARQAELRASEGAHRALVQALPDMVMRFDRTGRYLFVSENASAAFGLPAALFIGKTHRELNFPEAQCRFWEETIQRVFASETLYETELSVDGNQGPMILNVRFVPEFDGLGAAQTVLSIGRDITAHRQTEQKYQTLFRAMLEGFALHEIICDSQGAPVNYRFLAVNPAFERMTGQKAAAVTDRTVLEILPHTEKHWIETYGRVALTGEPVFFESYSAELKKHFEVTAFRPGPNQFACIFSDITERKRVEEQVRGLLAESNRSRLALLGIIEDENRAKADLKRLAMAIEQAAEIIVITDAQGVIQYVNPAFETVTGYSSAEAIGQNPRILQSGQHDAAFYRGLWDTLASGKIWHGRFVNRRKNGEIYTEDATLSPVRDLAGGIANYVAVKRDITAELRMESQLAQALKMESVGRLAGGVAHDFNNMLMGIMGYADLCRGDGLPAGHPIRGYLDEITNGARRSADLTRQLLAFARKQTISPQVLDLNEAVTGMLNLLRRLIGERIELVWRPDLRACRIRIDPSQIDQILANLCVNARDAIEHAGQIVMATANVAIDPDFCAGHAGFIPGEYVLLEVSDNGCGMDKELLAHIFEPFFTTKGVGEGTGLGLSTVYGIIKQNNGFIYVDSEAGQGTTFKIYLPRFAGAAVKGVVEVAPQASRSRGETILLVEDEDVLRAICRLFLTEFGYHVLVAATPAAALELAARHAGEIHLMLTDMVMPGMNGRQLTDRMHAIRPGMKCMIMSGYAADAMGQDDLAGLDVPFLEKPFSRDVLVRKVREVLEGSNG
jgi:PAS domain S-box-containing protein